MMNAITGVTAELRNSITDRAGGPCSADARAFHSAARETAGADATMPVAQSSNTALEMSLIRQLIALLQKQPSEASTAGVMPPRVSNSPNSVAGGDAASFASAGSVAPNASPLGVGTSGDTIASTVPQLVSLLQQVLSELQGNRFGSSAGNTMPRQTTMVPADAFSPSAGIGGAGSEATVMRQLLPLLQQQVAGRTTGEVTPLIQQLISELQAQGAPQPGATGTGAQPAIAATQPAQPAAASSAPAMGISGTEISAMLAHANGTGPEVSFSG